MDRHDLSRRVLLASAVALAATPTMAGSPGLRKVVTGGAVAPLPFAPVVILLGDSQAVGTLSGGIGGADWTAMASRYVVSDKVKALSSANTWETYHPATITGGFAK